MATDKRIAQPHDNRRNNNPDLRPKPPELREQWLSNDALQSLPTVRRDFDMNRDPMIAAQLQDNNKTEAQRRREQAEQRIRNQSKDNPGRNARMVEEDHPHPAPHPTGPIADAVDNVAFRDRWLAEQRDAAMEQALDLQQQDSLKQEMTRAAAPSKTPSHGPER